MRDFHAVEIGNGDADFVVDARRVVVVDEEQILVDVRGEGFVDME